MYLFVTFCKTYRYSMYICNVIIKQLKKMKVALKQIGNQTYLDFFNSKEVYSIKAFDTVRKAVNYATKYKYEIFYTLPLGIKGFENNN